jgi:quinol monooxygenase YgiN
MTRLIAVKSLIALAVLAGAGFAQAQNQSIPNAPASPAKKELVQRLLTMQQPALESMARDLVERPARQMMAAADEALQVRVPPEKRQAVAKQIQDLMRKYRDESGPMVRERATKVGQASLGPMFEEKFSEDELRQLLAALEAPAYKKFQQSLPDLTTAFAQALVKDLEPSFEPKLKVLEQGVGAALGITSEAASAPKAAKPAASAASKPAKK